MIKIEKNIPVPSNTGKGRVLKYPWPYMAVGDSFYVPNGNRNSLYAGTRNWSRKLGTKYVRRSDAGGIRVWRSA